MARLDIEAHIIIDEATLEAAEDKLLDMCNIPGVECLSWRQVNNTPKVIELDDILTTSGAGWLEDHYTDDQGVEGRTLYECVWIYGLIIDTDGCRIDKDYTRSHYCKPLGLRVWDSKPTEAQMQEAEWHD